MPEALAQMRPSRTTTLTRSPSRSPQSRTDGPFPLLGRRSPSIVRATSPTPRPAAAIACSAAASISRTASIGVKRRSAASRLRWLSPSRFSCREIWPVTISV